MGFLSAWFDNLFAIIKTFQIMDFVDILCITFVIFGIFKLVRETRAEQLLKGIIVLVIVYYLSYVLKLTMFTALLKNFFEFGVIIIFIIFQPEIRKALEQIGRSNIAKRLKFGVSQSNKEDELIAAQRKAIEAVASAAMFFHTSKTGALIVFECATKLGDIIDTGTIIDAQPSVSIIGNLFFNKAPLHDGAVIIREGKIYAAGCILPLTKNENIDSELGTRHRAALGMSEESDAAIVVVSEETGSISFAYKGKITRDLTREMLVEKLNHYVLPVEKTDLVELIPVFSAKRKEKKHEKK
ncbi:MAG: diadenylate cyclase CdaA [Acutalibacteraceae bacterium]